MIVGLLLVALLFFAAAFAFQVAVYLVIGVGYLVYGAVVAAGWLLFVAGWLIWHGAKVGYRVLDWSVDKCAPPIAARWHRWRDDKAVPAQTERRPPPKEIGVIHWGYGHLNPARFMPRELPAARTKSPSTRR